MKSFFTNGNGGGSDDTTTKPGLVINKTRLAKRIITVAAWIKIPSNPYQRDENLRIKLGKAKHLRKYLPTHRQVTAGVLPDGSLLKIDGHTRAEGWRRVLEDGDTSVCEEVPADVEVTLIPIANKTEAVRYYKTIDSPDAVPTTGDNVSSVERYTGIAPLHSPYFVLHKYKTAVKVAYAILSSDRYDPKNAHWQARRQGLDDAMGALGPIIMQLDPLGLSANLRASEAAGMIVATALYGDIAPECFAKYLAPKHKWDETHGEAQNVHARLRAALPAGYMKKRDAEVEFVVSKIIAAVSRYQRQGDRMTKKELGGLAGKTIKGLIDQYNGRS